MAYISVVPESKLVAVDGQPFVLEDLSYPEEVLCLYFDTLTKKGNRQSTDPTVPLSPIEYADIKLYHDAHKREAKKAAKKPATQQVLEQQPAE